MIKNHPTVLSFRFFSLLPFIVTPYHRINPFFRFQLLQITRNLEISSSSYSSFFFSSSDTSTMLGSPEVAMIPQNHPLSSDSCWYKKTVKIQKSEKVSHNHPLYGTNKLLKSRNLKTIFYLLKEYQYFDFIWHVKFKHCLNFTKHFILYDIVLASFGRIHVVVVTGQ